VAPAGRRPWIAGVADHEKQLGPHRHAISVPRLAGRRRPPAHKSHAAGQRVREVPAVVAVPEAEVPGGAIK
jgi:hypothetical protein